MSWVLGETPIIITQIKNKKKNNIEKNNDYEIEIATIEKLGQLFEKNSFNNYYVWTGLNWEKIIRVEEKEINYNTSEEKKENRLCAIFNSRNLIRGLESIKILTNDYTNYCCINQKDKYDLIGTGLFEFSTWNVIFGYLLNFVQIKIKDIEKKLITNEEFHKNSNKYKDMKIETKTKKYPYQAKFPVSNIYSDQRYENTKNLLLENDKKYTDLELLNSSKLVLEKEISSVQMNRIKIREQENIYKQYLFFVQIYIMILEKAGYKKYSFRVMNGRCIWINQIVHKKMIRQEAVGPETWDELEYYYDEGRKSIKQKLRIVPFILTKTIIYQPSHITDKNYNVDRKIGGPLFILPSIFKVYRVVTQSKFWCAGLGKLVLYD